MFNEAFWDEYMGLYDRAIGTMWPYRKLLSDVVGATESGAMSVLDLGCGTGNLLALLLKSGARELFGVERQRTAVAIAQKKLETAHAEIHALDLEGDPWELDLPPVDVVFSVNVLYALEDPHTFLLRTRSCLRRGGVFVLTNPYRPEPARILEAHLAWLEQATIEERVLDEACVAARNRVAQMNDMIAGAARQERAHFWDPQHISGALHGSGFEVLRLRTDAYEGVNVLAVACRR